MAPSSFITPSGKDAINIFQKSISKTSVGAGVDVDVGRGRLRRPSYLIFIISSLHLLLNSRKKLSERLNSIVKIAINHQQEACAPLFQPRLPRADCLRTQKSIIIRANHAWLMRASQQAQTHQPWRSIHLALFS